MEILWGFSYPGSLFLCILIVESSGESLERSFISWMVVDTLYEGISV